MAMAKPANYTVLKKIASGGMAEVFLVKIKEQLGIIKLGALKKILPENMENSEFIGMFQDEIRMATSFSHKNIVKVFDFSCDTNEIFMTMEFIHGVTLKQLIDHLRKQYHQLPFPYALYILTEVAEGLHYAAEFKDLREEQKLNLIHRDISPDNIMISFEGEIKIIDFGIAKGVLNREQTKAGNVKGKVAYMSPEQIKREPLDLRSDIFSLGIVLWELLTNSRFFSGHTVSDVRKKIHYYSFEQLDFGKGSSELLQLKEILRKCLHENPNERYSSHAEFIRDISFFSHQNFPQFSHLDFSLFMKNFFNEKYKDDVAEIGSLLRTSPNISYDPSYVERPLSNDVAYDYDYTHLSIPLEAAPRRIAFNAFNVVGLIIFVLTVLYFWQKPAEVRAPSAEAESAARKPITEIKVFFDPVPADAEVLIDNVPFDKTKGHFTISLIDDPGHNVEVRKSGYYPYKFKMKPDISTSYKVILQPK